MSYRDRSGRGGSGNAPGRRGPRMAGGADRAGAPRTGSRASYGRAARTELGPSRSERAREREEARLEETFLSRRRFVLGALGVAGAFGLARLLDYQVLSHDRYVGEANARRLTSTTLFAKRGTVYDRNGNVLASSVECSNVYVNPQLITDTKKAVLALVDVLGVDRETTLDLCQADTTFNYIQRQVDEEDVEKLRAKGISGIEFEPTVKRVYPYGGLASQVLGTVNLDNQGITGLESYYDDVLTGTNGSLVRERAADGGYVAGGAYEKEAAQDGVDLVLCIDANIQQAAEQAMAQAVEDAGAKYGSAVVCDPTTGEILAACSYPTYSQDDLASARTEDMNLRVVSDAYEPGSVFKPIVAGMAIDLGIMDPDTNFTVPATVKAGSDDISDVDQRDYTMDMTLREILRRSSNTGMVLVGEKVGEDNFAKYLERYQIGGASSGVDFPGESPGIVKDRSEYDGASLGAMSFGQSIAAAPIEIMRAIAGIANGGLMPNPHFLKSKQGEELDWTSKQDRCISAEAAEQVVSMMETVVAEGTGKAAQIEGYTIAGKTGTAERAGENGYEEGNNMASFIGFTSPSDPRAMVYITLDGTANNSAFAIPPFRTIMQAAIDALGIKQGS